VKYVPVPTLTPVYMPHLTEQIKCHFHSHSLIITIMHVLPEDTLNWMPSYTQHKYKGDHHYACVCLTRWHRWL